MCFHSKQSKDAQTVEKRFNAKIKDIASFNEQSEFNGFTFPQTPIITNEDQGVIEMFHWGLIPEWSKDESIRQYTLNARIETIQEKPSFKNYINNRCLIIADGFYEWKWLDNKGNKKQKHLIALPNEALYAYAGIYSQWVNEQTGEIVNSYAIVTTAANDVVGAIHRKQRMPVILQPEDEQRWLSGDAIEKYQLPYQVELIAKNMDSQQMLF